MVKHNYRTNTALSLLLTLILKNALIIENLPTLFLADHIGFHWKSYERYKAAQISYTGFPTLKTFPDFRDIPLEFPRIFRIPSCFPACAHQISLTVYASKI